MASFKIEFDWREAFDKFGFHDGDSWNGTDLVSDFLEEQFNVKTECDSWGCHNYMIMAVKDQDGKNLIPEENFSHGYDEPDEWMPKEWVEALDEHFDENWEQPVGAWY